MRKVAMALVFSFLSFSALAAAEYSVEDTTIGTLMNDPQASAVLKKYLPKTTGNEQFSMAYSMTLEAIVPYDQTGELTKDNLAKINAELQKLDAQPK